MAYVNGGKHFGQYTYEHWFDHEYENNLIIEGLKIDEINFLSNMINNIFDEFVGKDYSEEGNKTFKEYVKPENILTRFNNETSQFFIVRYETEIIGVLEIKNKKHISLFFIKKEFHNKGIGKKLFEYYLNIIKEKDFGIKIVTVHSSIYAEGIYSKLGFIKTNEIQERDGIKYIPMERKL